MIKKQILNWLLKILRWVFITLGFIYCYMVYSSVDFTSVDPNVHLPYLGNISLYTLAKIWLVGNIFALLFSIFHIIAYKHYCKLLNKGLKEESIQISNYWPIFISNYLKGILTLSTGPDKFRKKLIKFHQFNVLAYLSTTSILFYYLLA